MLSITGDAYIRSFPVLYSTEVNLSGFSPLDGRSANQYLPSDFFSGSNIYDNAYGINLPELPTGATFCTLAKGDRRLINKTYQYDITLLHSWGVTLNLHRCVNGVSDGTNYIFNGANNTCYINAYLGPTQRNLAFAVELVDNTNNLHGYALYVGYATHIGEGYQYGFSQPSYIFVQEKLKEADEQYLKVRDTDYDEEDYGPPSEPDGYGQDVTPAFDHTSDTIGIPDAPSVSTSSVGFMHVYKVASGALATLGQYLFPSAQNITDIESALRAMAGIFAYRDSVQYIVDLHAIPVSPTVGTSEYIKIGSLSTDISQPVVPSDYVDFDCGSISVPEQYCNFVDYIGTRCKLFLPFVGFVEIAPEYWNGGTLSVKYRFNVIDGSFMAYVLATSSKSLLSSSLIGQYGGSACLHLPVIANSYGALASGLVGGSMQIAAGAATGNIGAVATGALTASNFQGNMSQSNNYNASTSFLGGRRPYLLIEREVPCFSGLYNKDKGLPLNVAVSLASVHGFTVIEDIDLSGITGATENELDELRTLLREGVYF